MGFAYRSFMNSKSLVNCLVWNYNQYFEKFEGKKLGDAPENFTIVYVHNSLYCSFIANPQSALERDSKEMWDLIDNSLPTF